MCISLEEFVASKIQFQYSDLSSSFIFGNHIDMGDSGFAYLPWICDSKINTCCYILKRIDSNGWYLSIANCQYESNSIEELEKVLYEWAVDEFVKAFPLRLYDNNL